MLLCTLDLHLNLKFNERSILPLSILPCKLGREPLTQRQRPVCQQKLVYRTVATHYPIRSPHDACAPYDLDSFGFCHS